MPRESQILQRILGESEALLDWAKYRFRRRRARGNYHIQAYRGHGTADQLFVSGRVFEGLPIPAANAADATMRNLWYTLRRLGSDEVPAALIRASVDGISATVLADDEGFFEAALAVPTLAGTDEAWRGVELELLDPIGSDEPVRTTCLSVVPPEDARFGVISDIDDTVVRTDVANLLRMMRLVLLTNAHTRLPFPGVAAFYRALHEGTAGRFTNPVFYVSSSPWNFYDLLTEVFEVHDVPAGPLFLKDFGLARDLLLSRGHEEHKGRAIDHILETHPGLPFVLIGDSGQKDPEVYRDAVRRHPGRILTIYIRDVTEPARDAEVHAIAADISAYGVEMVLVQDSLSAARHAVDRGLIDAGALHDVREERG